MTHLSSISAPFGKPFTTNRYLHAPLSENIVSMWPSSMVMIGEIADAYDPHIRYAGHHNESALPSAAMIFTLKRESDMLFRLRKTEAYRSYLWDHDFMPYRNVTYQTRKDGIPVHAFYKDMDVIRFHEEAFCDSARVSTAYVKVTLENTLGFAQDVELGALVRTAREFDLVGSEEPDGYEEQIQNRDKWFFSSAPYREEKDCLTDGQYRFYYPQKEQPRRGGASEKQPDLIFSVHLAPYEKKSFTFALTRNPNKPLSYVNARKKAIAYWQDLLAKAQNIPDKKGVEPLFYHFLTQELQMFSHPQGAKRVIMRQGGRQRYHWPEAVEMVAALARIGGYNEYLDLGLAHYFHDLQEKEGENKGRVHYACVPWITRTATALQMLGHAAMNDRAMYDRYIEEAMDAYRWIERERHKTVGMEGAVEGLFPPGIATDNPFAQAQQWTACDIKNLCAIQIFLSMLKKQNSPYCAEVEAGYTDYFNICKNIFDGFVEEQKDAPHFRLPRTAQNDPVLEEALDKDPFRYLHPNKLLSSGVAGFGTPAAERIIEGVSYGGQCKNGLLCSVYRSTTGVGRTWYTSSGEYGRVFYYLASGERERAKKLIDAQLRYNVTTEYYQGERYDDHNAYVVPWMPNASANGRLLMMLFDYYGSRVLS